MLYSYEGAKNITGSQSAAARDHCAWLTVPGLGSSLNP